MLWPSATVDKTRILQSIFEIPPNSGVVSRVAQYHRKSPVQVNLRVVFFFYQSAANGQGGAALGMGAV